MASDEKNSTNPPVDPIEDELGVRGTDELIEEVGRALTEDYRLPFRIMSDPDIYERELLDIYNRTWIFVGHESEIPRPGDYARRRIGEDQFIFIRDETGEINVFFDACRHRGAQLCRAEEGNASHFRCPFHAWTYNNQGELVGIPDKDTCYDGIDESELGLQPAPGVESYEGFVFACLDPQGPTFEKYIGDFKWYLDVHFTAPEEGWEVVGSPHRWTFDSNWKMGGENFGGDDYHFYYLHQSGIEAGFMNDVYDADPGSNVFGCRQRHHCFANGHKIVLGEIDRQYVDDGRPMYGYTPEMKDRFTPEGLSEEQWEIFRDGILCVGTFFPNFAFLHQGLGDTTEQNGVFTVRKFAPRGPTTTELISWHLVPAGAPAEQKEMAHRILSATFSPSGVHEQDDAAAWSWVTNASDTTFVKSHGFTTHLERGMNGMSDTDRVDDTFPGPGKVLDSPYTDAYALEYYKTWQRAMTGDYPE